jgi:chemotaxis protein histidine kinase CheA
VGLDAVTASVEHTLCGKVTVESAVGEGTTFTLTVPAVAV